MIREQFDDCMAELCDCFNGRPNQKQMEIWFKHLNGCGYGYSDLAKAVEKLSISELRFPPLSSLLKACREQQSRRLEVDADRLKETDKQPFRVLLSDGASIQKYIPKVLAALNGTPGEKQSVRQELGW